RPYDVWLEEALSDDPRIELLPPLPRIAVDAVQLSWSHGDPADRFIVSMARTDLIALTPESIAALTVVGFVKRAQREIAAGDGPALDELDDGTVIGTFKDGVIAKLVPGKTFKDTPCTCGASAGCRHRVAVALSYR